MEKENLSLAALVGAGFIAAQSILGALGGGKLLKPPGAVSDEDFISRCISCGKCVLACPYGSILTATVADGRAAGTPYIDPRRKACRLCVDFPCIEVCPTGALSSVDKPSDVRMGTAVIDERICAAYSKGHRCEVCYRVCPLINEAISVEFRDRPGDDIHMIFAPIVNEEKCVGCGICVERCVVSLPETAVTIVPR
ncbi:MAG: 4Fe-4S binding protein [Coriobacteriia bacterium]|nr:4Fe-4S binding protein [Coriobacteriia bacterium]